MDMHAVAAALRALASALEAEPPAADPPEEDADELAAWLTVEQVARHFGISRSTVYRLIASGDWPQPVRLPGMRHRRYSVEQLDGMAGPASGAS